MDHSHSPTQVAPLALTVKETGRALGLSRWAIMRLINQQKIRSQRVGRRIVVSIKSINEWLHGEQQSQGTTSW